MLGQARLCLGESKSIVRSGIRFLIRADIGIGEKSILTWKKLYLVKWQTSVCIAASWKNKCFLSFELYCRALSSTDIS